MATGSNAFNFLRQYIDFWHTHLGMPKLTLSWRRYLSYRNQSINLYSKSVDWFLYDRDFRSRKSEFIDKKKLPEIQET